MSAAPRPGGSAEDQDLLDVLTLLAERAGKIVLKHYVALETEVRTKDDASPVTDADEETEDFLLQALATLTPDIPVVSEEAASANGLPVGAPGGEGGRFWLVDPLDGTKEFLSRNGEFTVNVALVEGGRPIAGVVHAPALAMTWAGAALGSARFSQTDQPAMGIASRAIPPEGATVVASRRHGDNADLERFLAGYKVAAVKNAGSSLKFCLLASGQADLYPRFGRTMEWDTAAGHAVLLAAGGRVETAAGEPLRYGKPGFENPYFIAYGR
jgi:3'(2'), 5'-bisphosphate nucleotidase